MGVNLAGVEIILNMRARMEAMQRQMGEFITSLNRELAMRVPVQSPREQNSLVPILRYTEPIIEVPAKKSVKTRRKRAV
jgi:MerR family transcriptional regulator/heat shock protein HspR